MKKNRVNKSGAWLARVPALLLAAALPFSAGADVYTFTDAKSNVVRLFEDQCPAARGWLKMYRAEFRFEGNTYAACWLVVRTTVLVFDETGDITPIPVFNFTKEVEA